MKTIEGNLSASGLKFAIVSSRFNDFIGSKLLDGAIDCIKRSGGDEKDVTVYRCPGSYEIPMVAQKVAAAGKVDAVICLGVLIKGSTLHFDLIASEVAKGIAHASLVSGIPMAFGVLTTDTIEQAIERAGTKAGNKGFEAAMTAIEMASLFKKI
jgi:6,7-dimethyl-8-ribityllumazine synthase